MFFTFSSDYSYECRVVPLQLAPSSVRGRALRHAKAGIQSRRHVLPEPLTAARRASLARLREVRGDAERETHSPSTALVMMLRWISLEPP